MSSVLVQSGVTEPITVHLVDSGGAAVSGLSPTITIRREDSTSWWNGSAMVASGVELAMSEVDAAEATGDYRYNFATSGADSAKYVLEVTPSSVSGVSNLPAVGGLEVSKGALLSMYQGFVWIDGLGSSQGGIGTPGQVLGVNGLQSNPVTTFADARAVADGLGIRAFRVRGNHDIDQEYKSWRFEGWSNNRDSRARVRLRVAHVVVAKFEGLEIAAGGADGTLLDCFDCLIAGGHQNANGRYINCEVGGTWDIAAAGDVAAVDCFREGSSSGWSLSSFFATSASKWNVRRFSGGLEFSELVSGNTIDVGLSDGSVSLDGFNVVSGTINITGVGRATGVAASGVIVDLTGLVDPADIQRLHGENVRTRLYFPTAAVVSGQGGAVRNVPLSSASHMELESKLEAASDWSAPAFSYFVLFNYGASANVGDAPKASAIVQIAPTDGTFNTVPYPS